MKRGKWADRTDEGNMESVMRESSERRAEAYWEDDEDIDGEELDAGQ